MTEELKLYTRKYLFKIKDGSSEVIHKQKRYIMYRKQITKWQA